MSRKIEFVEKMDIDKVKLWEQNPRFNDVAAERLAEILRVHGFIDPIILDKNYIVRAGNTRVKAAKLAGIKCVPALIVDFKDEEMAEAYSIANNRSNEWAEWDYKALEELVNDIKDYNPEELGITEGILLDDSQFDIYDFVEEEKEEREAKENDRMITCPCCGVQFSLKEARGKMK